MQRLALIAAIILASQPAEAQRGSARRDDSPPVRPGTCAYTHVRMVTQRLEDGRTRRVIPDSGSAVTFANGLYQVSYEQVPAVNRSRRGDPVFICLVRLPTHCPPGDNRGRFYTTTNLRTMESWTLPDAQHMCGGA
jgi:hypothetical protein